MTSGIQWTVHSSSTAQEAYKLGSIAEDNVHTPTGLPVTVCPKKALISVSDGNKHLTRSATDVFAGNAFAPDSNDAKPPHAACTHKLRGHSTTGPSLLLHYF